MSATAGTAGVSSVHCVGVVTAPASCSRHCEFRQVAFRRPYVSRSLKVPRPVCASGETSRNPRYMDSPPSSPPFPAAKVSSPTNDVFPRKVSSVAVSGVLEDTSTLERKFIDKESPTEASQLAEWIADIRGMFENITDGEISPSPYDTAWVALVPAFDGSRKPQFPKCLDWVIENQFSDGSWGDEGYLLYSDRIINTLACVVALKTWGEGAASVARGVKYIRENLQKIETDEDAHTLIGFELTFPALLLYAKDIGLDLPYDAPVVLSIYAEREKKLNKMPMDPVQQIPSTLLYSLEAYHKEADWEKIIKLQSPDGSFLGSPSATAACLIHVKDEKALSYINGLLERFNNAVPNSDVVDLFERMWMIDRLQRLGIDRYFEKEIKVYLEYIYKYYERKGVAWGRGSRVHDLDDTAMCFRILRQHGYDVHEDIFRQFRDENGEFGCFTGQSHQAITGLFNFYRATQIRFPGETLLEGGEAYARSFLADKHAKNECFDKWIITNDLPGEVGYALETPWYSSLPRIETRSYVNQYGPEEIWIGKVLYRMPSVSNSAFLNLAKADFNLCQSIHRQELEKTVRWYNEEGRFPELSFGRHRAIENFFGALLPFAKPELSQARFTCARCMSLTTIVDDFFEVGEMTDKRKFVTATKEWDPSLMERTNEDAQLLFNALYSTVNAIAQEALIGQGRDFGGDIRKLWSSWVDTLMIEVEWAEKNYWPSFDEYCSIAYPSAALEPILVSSCLFLGEQLGDEYVDDSKRIHLMGLVLRVTRLLNDIRGYEDDGKPQAVSILMRENPQLRHEEIVAKIRELVQESMLELVRETHLEPSHLPKSIRQAHFDFARMMHLFYKTLDGYTKKSEEIQNHVRQLLFEPV